MSARGAANALTRTTAILAAGFFITSLSLGILARYGSQPTDILDQLPANQGQGQTGSGDGGSLLDQLGGLPTEESGGTTAPAANGEAPVVAPTAPSAPVDDGSSLIPESTLIPDLTSPEAGESAPAAGETSTDADRSTETESPSTGSDAATQSDAAPTGQIPANPAPEAPNAADPAPIAPIEAPSAVEQAPETPLSDESAGTATTGQGSASGTSSPDANDASTPATSGQPASQ